MKFMKGITNLANQKWIQKFLQAYQNKLFGAVAQTVCILMVRSVSTMQANSLALGAIHRRQKLLVIGQKGKPCI